MSQIEIRTRMQVINQVVSVELHDNTALICLDNPPVNIASLSLSDGLKKAIIWARLILLYHLFR